MGYCLEVFISCIAKWICTSCCESVKGRQGSHVFPTLLSFPLVYWFLEFFFSQQNIQCTLLLKIASLSPNCKQYLNKKYIEINILISPGCCISSWHFMRSALLIFILSWVAFSFSMLWHQDGSLQLLPCRFWWAICWEMQAAHISLAL